MTIFEKRESDVRSYCRAFPTVFTKAKMSKIYAEDGKEYLDFFAGAGALNYGHNNDYIKERIVEYLQGDGIVHSLDMFTGAKTAFLENFDRLVLTPKKLDYKVMFCGPTGTNATEAAMKLCRKNTGRNRMFAFTGSFHGMTQGALSITSGKSIRANSADVLSNVTFIPHPKRSRYITDTIGYMEDLLADEYSGVDKPAAVFLETVQAEGGVIVSDIEFLKALRAFCTKHEILLVIDDIQVGCGRTGSFFSFERAGIVPDMVLLSKSIGGIGMPMSLLLFHPELDKFAPAEHNGTFRGNQLSMVSGAAALEYYFAENLDGKTAENQKIINEFVDKRILPLNPQIEHRGLGMIHGIDFGSGELSGKVSRECFENGLIIERCGQNDRVLKILPPLVLTKDELIQGLEIIEKAAKKYC